MSSLNWKSRTFIAVATASLLTGAGAVALANTVATPASAPTSSNSADSTSALSGADALQQSLDALAAQADSLAQSVADGAREGRGAVSGVARRRCGCRSGDRVGQRDCAGSGQQRGGGHCDECAALPVQRAHGDVLPLSL